ncbi:MAG TPA: hypothetical protein VF145_11660 [Chitinophagaceae bacterium]
MRKLSKFLLPVLLLLPSAAYCQHFAFSAKLEEVKETGFYSIQVTPELSSHLNLQLADLRIIDAKGRHVPYILQSGLTRLEKEYFQPLPIIENAQKDSGSTHLVVQNNTGRDLNALTLILRNSATERMARISGSDDGSSWFIIAESLSIPRGESLEKDRFVAKLDFPRSSYRYLRILVFNGKSDPVNILEAGITTPRGTGEYSPMIINPEPFISQVDSADGYTYIKVIQPAAYHVSAVQIRLNGAKLYRRRAMIESTGGEFEISSANDFVQVPAFKTKEFTVKIFNGDNPALQVAVFQTFQPARNIISYLERGNEYKVLMENPQAKTPSYDLQSFADSLPSQFNPIGYEAIAASIQPADPKESKRITLWLIIAGVLALLTFFTWNLTHELSKKQ